MSSARRTQHECSLRDTTAGTQRVRPPSVRLLRPYQIGYLIKIEDWWERPAMFRLTHVFGFQVQALMSLVVSGDISDPVH